MVARLLAVGAVLLLASAAARAQVSFFTLPTYAGGGNLFVADFNGDGKPDILTSDGTMNLGKGDGTFTAGTPVKGGALAVADFNGDGKPDVLQQGTGTLLVLLGNGDGTFQKPISTNSGANLTPIAAGDLTGKSYADVVGVFNNSLVVYLSKGDGTFANGVAYNLSLPAGSSVTSIILGDVNGDGKTDVTVIAQGNTSGLVIVFLGNGDGSLQSTPKTSTGLAAPGSAVEGDFNGDGKPDLAISANPSCNGTCQVYLQLGNGDGTFQALTAVISGSGSLAAADVNGDGKLDLIVDESSTLLEIYLGNGDGTFASGAVYFQGGVWWPTYLQPVIADFNLDGKPDVAADDVVLLGNGNGTLQGVPAVPAGISQLAIGDFEKNGTLDVAGIGTSGSSVYILTNNGTGALTLAYTYALQQPAYGIATADLNGDGNLDLVVTGQDPTTQEWSYSVLLGRGDGSFQPPAFYAQSVTGVPSALLIADFNNDHKPDLAVALGSNTSQSLALLLGNGDGTFGSPAYIFDAGAATL